MKADQKVNVVIKQEEEALVDAEILAGAIVKLDEAAQKLVKSGLKQEAIVVLLNDMTKVYKSDIRFVLNGLAELRKRYTTL